MPKKSTKSLKKLTKAQKRVIVAEDVLAALKLEQYTAMPGVYIDSQARWEIANGCSDAEDFQTALQDDLESCHVCAVGAAALSCIRKFDGVDPSEMAEADAHSLAQSVFSESQLNLMEMAFEVQSVPRADLAELHRAGSYTKVERSAQLFGARYPSAASRLRAIFKNIIANKGVFTPPPVP